ncbi:MAG: RuBisCO large subunit C-terminal-like domain-containing protein [Gaiellaceae bacterium]
MRATYEIDPPEWAERLAVLESVGLPDAATEARGRVVEQRDRTVTLEFPALAGETDATLLVSSLVAGEWGDRADMRSCRLVEVEWPAGLPGPAFTPPGGAAVGAIVKPALGLEPAEAATVAAELAAGGAVLVKDDELMTSPRYSPLEERTRLIAAGLPEGVRYAANVSGPHEELLARARTAVAAGAGALMLNAFAQGLGALQALRAADLGVPIFAHRVGAAFLRRGGPVTVSARVLAELTLLLGADYVQVGSFGARTFDTDEEVLEQIAACAGRATAVIGGGVGPANAGEQLDRAGARAGIMLLLGSEAYAHPDGVRAGVAATVAAL